MGLVGGVFVGGVFGVLPFPCIFEEVGDGLKLGVADGLVYLVFEGVSP